MLLNAIKNWYKEVELYLEKKNTVKISNTIILNCPHKMAMDIVFNKINLKKIIVGFNGITTLKSYEKSNWP